jgi:predicted Zn-dependent protease
MFQRDYLLRMIDMAAQAIARALRLLLAKQPEEAEQQLNTAYSALPIDRELLLLLDAKSVRAQLGDDGVLQTVVKLLVCDAEVQLHKNDARAALRRLRAARRLEALPLALPPDPALNEELERVARLVEAAL